MKTDFDTLDNLSRHHIQVAGWALRDLCDTGNVRGRAVQEINTLACSPDPLARQALADTLDRDMYVRLSELEPKSPLLREAIDSMDEFLQKTHGRGLQQYIDHRAEATERTVQSTPRRTPADQLRTQNQARLFIVPKRGI